MDLIKDVLPEAVEVRPPIGSLERDVVGDQGHRPGRIGADERIDIGVVRDRILRNRGCFTMRRHAMFSSMREERKFGRLTSGALQPRYELRVAAGHLSVT